MTSYIDIIMSDRSYSAYDDFDDDTWTPLYYAAINNRMDAMKLLLELGADPLYAYKGHTTVFRSIVRKVCRRTTSGILECESNNKVMDILMKYRDPITGKACGYLSPPMRRVNIYDSKGSSAY